KKWHARLFSAGYRRLMLVAGETGADERRQAITRLREGTVDLVVATSAFGLGVDQEDVRAVVHACIPETIDRFYQEVGRGGRDGRASLSLVLHCRRDRRVAQGINQTKLITREKAEARLRAMLAKAELLGGGQW